MILIFRHAHASPSARRILHPPLEAHFPVAMAQDDVKAEITSRFVFWALHRSAGFPQASSDRGSVAATAATTFVFLPVLVAIPTAAILATAASRHHQ